MSWEQCLFSKLIEACDMEWIPDEDALYGEPLGTIENHSGNISGPFSGTWETLRCLGAS